jgi:large subunit ribosomal protein L13
MTDYTIDARGKALGRVASEAAKALMGKMSVRYTPHLPSDVKVVITNVSNMLRTERKDGGKVYSTYSGYPGGLKRETLGAFRARKGHAEPVRRAVLRMLPNNRLRPGRMKNLTISE